MGPEPVRAGTDGRCVIHDGPLTLTAERHPDAPDKITLTVAGGTAEPVTYTLDYSDAAGTAVLTSAQSATGGGAWAIGGTLDGTGEAGSVAMPGQRYIDSHSGGEAGLAAAPDPGLDGAAHRDGDQPYQDQRYQPTQATTPGGGLPALGAGGQGGSAADRGGPRFAIAGDLFEPGNEAERPAGTALRITGSLDEPEGSS